MPDKLKGTYVLEFSILQELSFRVRSGKEFSLLPGLYAYVGSAFGSGGIPSRLYRHLKREKKRHWHLDFITTSPLFSPELVVLLPGLRVECRVASLISSLPGSFPVASFGSSDCSCPSHLFLVNDFGEVNGLICREFEGVKILKTNQPEMLWSLRSS
ncbi:MAG: GIY-YIG nuclease family protein [Desulfurobacteriaceae bacterium]